MDFAPLEFNGGKSPPKKFLSLEARHSRAIESTRKIRSNLNTSIFIPKQKIESTKFPWISRTKPLRFQQIPTKFHNETTQNLISSQLQKKLQRVRGKLNNASAKVDSKKESLQKYRKNIRKYLKTSYLRNYNTNLRAHIRGENMQDKREKTENQTIEDALREMGLETDENTRLYSSVYDGNEDVLKTLSGELVEILQTEMQDMAMPCEDLLPATNTTAKCDKNKGVSEISRDAEIVEQTEPVKLLPNEISNISKTEKEAEDVPKEIGLEINRSSKLHNAFDGTEEVLKTLNGDIAEILRTELLNITAASKDVNKSIAEIRQPKETKMDISKVTKTGMADLKMQEQTKTDNSNYLKTDMKVKAASKEIHLETNKNSSLNIINIYDIIDEGLKEMHEDGAEVLRTQISNMETSKRTAFCDNKSISEISNDIMREDCKEPKNILPDLKSRSTTTTTNDVLMETSFVSKNERQEEEENDHKETKNRLPALISSSNTTKKQKDQTKRMEASNLSKTAKEASRKIISNTSQKSTPNIINSSGSTTKVLKSLNIETSPTIATSKTKALCTKNLNVCETKQTIQDMNQKELPTPKFRLKTKDSKFMHRKKCKKEKKRKKKKRVKTKLNNAIETIDITTEAVCVTIEILDDESDEEHHSDNGESNSMEIVRTINETEDKIVNSSDKLTCIPKEVAKDINAVVAKDPNSSEIHSKVPRNSISPVNNGNTSVDHLQADAKTNSNETGNTLKELPATDPSLSIKHFCTSSEIHSEDPRNSIFPAKNVKIEKETNSNETDNTLKTLPATDSSSSEYQENDSNSMGHSIRNETKKLRTYSRKYAKTAQPIEIIPNITKETNTDSLNSLDNNEIIKETSYLSCPDAMDCETNQLSVAIPNCSDCCQLQTINSATNSNEISNEANTLLANPISTVPNIVNETAKDITETPAVDHLSSPKSQSIDITTKSQDPIELVENITKETNMEVDSLESSNSIEIVKERSNLSCPDPMDCQTSKLSVKIPNCSDLCQLQTAYSATNSNEISNEKYSNGISKEITTLLAKPSCTRSTVPSILNEIAKDTNETPLISSPNSQTIDITTNSPENHEDILEPPSATLISSENHQQIDRIPINHSITNDPPPNFFEQAMQTPVDNTPIYTSFNESLQEVKEFQSIVLACIGDFNSQMDAEIYCDLQNTQYAIDDFSRSLHKTYTDTALFELEQSQIFAKYAEKENKESSPAIVIRIDAPEMPEQIITFQAADIMRCTYETMKESEEQRQRIDWQIKKLKMTKKMTQNISNAPQTNEQQSGCKEVTNFTDQQETAISQDPSMESNIVEHPAYRTETAITCRTLENSQSPEQQSQNVSHPSESLLTVQQSANPQNILASEEKRQVDNSVHQQSSSSQAKQTPVEQVTSNIAHSPTSSQLYEYQQQQLIGSPGLPTSQAISANLTRHTVTAKHLSPMNEALKNNFQSLRNSPVPQSYPQRPTQSPTNLQAVSKQQLSQINQVLTNNQLGALRKSFGLQSPQNCPIPLQPPTNPQAQHSPRISQAFIDQQIRAVENSYPFQNSQSSPIIHSHAQMPLQSPNNLHVPIGPHSSQALINHQVRAAENSFEIQNAQHTPVPQISSRPPHAKMHTSPGLHSPYGNHGHNGPQQQHSQIPLQSPHPSTQHPAPTQRNCHLVPVSQSTAVPNCYPPVSSHAVTQRMHLQHMYDAQNRPNSSVPWHQPQVQLHLPNTQMHPRTSENRSVQKIEAHANYQQSHLNLSVHQSYPNVPMNAALPADQQIHFQQPLHINPATANYHQFHNTQNSPVTQAYPQVPIFAGQSNIRQMPPQQPPNPTKRDHPQGNYQENHGSQSANMLRINRQHQLTQHPATLQNHSQVSGAPEIRQHQSVLTQQQAQRNPTQETVNPQVHQHGNQVAPQCQASKSQNPTGSSKNKQKKIPTKRKSSDSTDIPPKQRKTQKQIAEKNKTTQQLHRPTVLHSTTTMQPSNAIDSESSSSPASANISNTISSEPFQTTNQNEPNFSRPSVLQNANALSRDATPTNQKSASKRSRHSMSKQQHNEYLRLLFDQPSQMPPPPPYPVSTSQFVVPQQLNNVQQNDFSMPTLLHGPPNLPPMYPGLPREQFKNNLTAVITTPLLTPPQSADCQNPMFFFYPMPQQFPTLSEPSNITAMTPPSDEVLRFEGTNQQNQIFLPLNTS